MLLATPTARPSDEVDLCFSYFALALRYTELRGFAAKNFRTVQNSVNGSPAR